MQRIPLHFSYSNCSNVLMSSKFVSVLSFSSVLSKGSEFEIDFEHDDSVVSVTVFGQWFPRIYARHIWIQGLHTKGLDERPDRSACPRILFTSAKTVSLRRETLAHQWTSGFGDDWVSQKNCGMLLAFHSQCLKVTRADIGDACLLSSLNAQPFFPHLPNFDFRVGTKSTSYNGERQ